MTKISSQVKEPKYLAAFKIWWWIAWRSIVLIFVFELIFNSAFNLIGEEMVESLINLDDLSAILMLIIEIPIGVYLHKKFINKTFGEYTLRLVQNV